MSRASIRTVTNVVTKFTAIRVVATTTTTRTLTTRSKPLPRSKTPTAAPNLPPPPSTTETANTPPLLERVKDSTNYKRNRSLFNAIAVGIIAATGAILGAQWKTLNQEKAKIANATATDTRTEETSPNQVNDTPLTSQPEADSSTIPAPLASSSNKNAVDEHSPAIQKEARLLAAQIQALKDTKARLITQKATLEQKIVNLYERKARKDELELARRKQQEQYGIVGSQESGQGVHREHGSVGGGDGNK